MRVMTGPSADSGLTDAFMVRALQEFALEAQGLGQEVESAVLALEQTPGDAAHINTIFRCFHTIKGSAGLFGFDGLEDFCHRLETALDPLRTGSQTLGSTMGTQLLRCNDYLRETIEHLCAGGALSRDVLAQGNALLQQWQLPSEPVRPVALAQPSPAQVSVEMSGTGQVTPLRVDPGKLDDIIALLGELAIAQSGAHAHAHRQQDSALLQSHERMQELTHAIRHKSMALRMVPIGETLNRFRRVVRDLGNALGKEATLDIVGGNTELDKSLVDKIADPLMHLVRNALDHGLETTAERTAAGKRAMGHLLLEAKHDAGHVTIVVEDDGRGIDKAQVLERARLRGLVSADREYLDQEIFALVFAPGFSTAEAITTVSGRGVGMDVVKSAVEALRGSVRIDSELGRGTRVILSLPLTLASFDGFMVRVDDTHYILPLAQVHEVVEAGAARVQQGVMDLRGMVVPVLPLRTLYGHEGAPAERPSVVVVRQKDDLFGIEVDALIGPQQTVLKSLGPLFRKLPGVAGSCLLGDGTVALVLDLDTLRSAMRDCAPAAGSWKSRPQYPA
jgi:chemotaxis protein histidine kinase CheA